MIMLAAVMFGTMGLFTTASYAESDRLVAYFSKGGTTKNVAQKLATSIGADLFEITSTDANPQIEKYNVVFIGFHPDKNARPAQIDTFVKNHNFTGKTIVPFVVLGSKDTVSQATTKIQTLAPGARVLEGGTFVPVTPANNLKSWAESKI